MDPVLVNISGILALLMCTSFVKVFTALTILRFGVGLTSSGFGLITFLLALSLTWVAVDPLLSTSNRNYSISDFISAPESVQNAVVRSSLLPFMIENTDPEIAQRIYSIRDQGGVVIAASQGETDLQVGTDLATHQEAVQGMSLTESVPAPSAERVSESTAAFLLSELQSAFQLGVLLLLPFIVIDLLVVNVLAALQVTQISAHVISLPLKLVLFVSVGGWQLLAEKLLSAYS